MPQGSVQIKAAANYLNEISISLNQQKRAENLKGETSLAVFQFQSLSLAEKAEPRNLQVKSGQDSEKTLLEPAEQLISLNTFKDLLLSKRGKQHCTILKA